jgi:hypothetical protein
MCTAFERILFNLLRTQNAAFLCVCLCCAKFWPTRGIEAARLLSLPRHTWYQNHEPCMQEKILPFHSVGEAASLPGSVSPIAEVNAEVAAFEADAHADSPEPLASAPVQIGEVCHGVDPHGRVVPPHRYLDNFFKRYNKVLIDKTAVAREAARLEQENGDLRTILKQYLDGISINEEALASPVNPLLIVNNRLQLVLRERDRSRAAALEKAQVVRQAVRSQ